MNYRRRTRPGSDTLSVLAWLLALCKSCHQGPRLGWHGERYAWSVRKMKELHALAVTVERLAQKGGL